MKNKGKKSRKNIVKNLNKKQLKHWKEFGEAHPAENGGKEGNYEHAGVKRVFDEDEDHTPAKRSVRPCPDNKTVSAGSSQKVSATSDADHSSSDEENDSFNQLLTSFDTTPGSRIYDADVAFSDEEDDDETQQNSDGEVDDHMRAVSASEPDEQYVTDSEVDLSDSDTEQEKQATSRDAFTMHFEATELQEGCASLLADRSKWKSHELKWPCIGRIILKESVADGIPSLSAPKPKHSVQEHNIKCVLIENIPKSLQLYKKEDAEKLSSFQLEMLSLMASYRDVYFPHRNFENAEDIRLIYTLHAVNHILKTRSKIVHHNNKMKQHPDTEYRDQGLTRPKVLMVLPFKESALRVVNFIISILFQDGKENVMNKKRFQQEYGTEDDHIQSNKPEDYKALFAGNVDDAFRIGIKITKKSMRLYSDFYSADIIVASPLGLRTIIGAEGEKDRDFDFLSSIEVLIFDQADIFLMQNWEHVLHLMQHLHLQPKEAHGVDFSRVRMWCLDGLSKYYRHTMVFSTFSAPPLVALFNKQCHNYAGSAVICNPIISGSVSQVTVHIPQVFQRFDTSSILNAPDDRFTFFVQKILPQYKDSIMKHTMIFIPSYFDFVRLRNYFKREDISFTQICEYSKDGKIAKARDMFFHGARHFLLYTERCHFYRRYRIKGIRHIIFYELPLYSHFYSELCNFLHPSMRRQKRNSGPENVSCTVLYSYLDAHQLAGVVGTEKSSLMINSQKKVHLFVTSEV